MSQPSYIPSILKGLTADEVLKMRETHGLNVQYHGRKNTWGKILLSILGEPMLIILLLVTTIYFFIGSFGEAYFMLGAILVVSGISFYQDNRSRMALEALQSLTAPKSSVIRDSVVQNIDTPEIVPGDLMIAEEGGFINADGKIVFSHDFSVNESSLTGEAHPAFKSESHDPLVYSGTVVSSGLAVIKVDKTGLQTRLGKLGISVTSIKDKLSPLQIQIGSFVRRLSMAGFLVFVVICLVSYFKSSDWLESLLKGLTLAMSILPEEIPVAFTTFMALGARRLINQGILVKKTRTVETLGNATVICIDKTGTITENKMSPACFFVFEKNQLVEVGDEFDSESKSLIETSMWASEPLPFDPMEKTIHDLYTRTAEKDRRAEFSMVHEYPLGGIPPMMTHVFENGQGEQIIASKGAPEAILAVSDLTEAQKTQIKKVMEGLAGKGYRILGTARAVDKLASMPLTQQEIRFKFLGFIAFVDPPKKGIDIVFRKFYDAGIKLKVITGDNPVTTKAIASEAKLDYAEPVIDGEELLQLDDTAVIKIVGQSNIFTRMFPEAKLKVIQALKSTRETVAMIGDGVNDGPALKAADIGIAMGIKGTEIAKNAADLILVDDDLSKLLNAIATGRRIYSNLKKAVQYIISIHIPIILTVSMPLLLGWTYPDIFTPMHVIFLELIMGPTCSIVYENEPLEKNAMLKPPRLMTRDFLNWREMGRSILQGLIISAGIFSVYYYALEAGYSEELTRSMVFVNLILANIFLTMTNRSAYHSFIASMKYKNYLMPGILGLTMFMLVVILAVPGIRSFFQLSKVPFQALLLCAGIAFVSVFWFELWKLIIEQSNRRPPEWKRR